MPPDRARRGKGRLPLPPLLLQPSPQLKRSGQPGRRGLSDPFQCEQVGGRPSGQLTQSRIGGSQAASDLVRREDPVSASDDDRQKLDGGKRASAKAQQPLPRPVRDGPFLDRKGGSA